MYWGVICTKFKIAWFGDHVINPAYNAHTHTRRSNALVKGLDLVSNFIGPFGVDELVAFVNSLDCGFELVLFHRSAYVPFPYFVDGGGVGQEEHVF